MKKISLLLISFLAAIASAQTVDKTFYIDFGENNVSSRGNLTKGADANGHYWTNVYSSPSERLYPTDWKLISSDNTTTDYVLQVGTYFHTNGMSGGGGLTSPSSSLLGDLAIATATQDYIHVETTQDYNLLTFTNLDVNKAYRFNLFGSRVVAEERGGYFEVRGETEWSEYMQMSGSKIGANGYDGNNNKILVSDPVFPTKEGKIVLFFNKKFKSGMMYLNCMKLEELSGLERPNQNLTLTQKMYIDFGETSNDSRGHQTTGFDKNGNYWSNVSSGSSSSNVIPANKVVSLFNSDRKSSGVKLTVLQQFLTNGVNNGGYNNPTEENLGDLAIQTATEDYAFTEDDNTHSIKFSGLNKDHCYRFYIFGSRSTSESDRRFAVFTLNGQETWTTGMATSGQMVGGASYHGNVRNVAVSAYIYPDVDGNITLGVLRNQSPKSNFAHFNVIKIEEYEGGVRPADPEVLKTAIVSGTANENGEDITMKELKPNGTSNGVFECYQKLKPGTFVLKGKDAQGNDMVMGSDADGNLVKDGSAFTVTEEQVVRMRYDSKHGTLTVTPVNLFLKGNIVANGTTVAYKGNGVFEQEVDMNYGTVFLFSDKYFYFAFNNDDNLAVKRLSGSRTSVGMPSEGFGADNIRMNRGTYTMTLDMNKYEWSVNAPINEYKISAFGSSVCNGQGASSNQGYAYLYGQQCQSRYKTGKSEYPFEISGVSIGGNTTQNLLDRYDEMIHDFGKYVIIGLSMGNEGLHGSSNKQGTFDQFKNNMLKLIDMMKNDGKTVVVMNNYTHGDYNDTDYSYIKNMDLLIHEWDVASVNTLGAIDDGAGHWADGYMADAAHPTTAGHRQFFYAMPPSMFDALEQGKPFPVRDMNQSTVLENGSTIKITGETTVNPYTISVRFKGSEAGKIVAFRTASGKESYVKVREDGYVEYWMYNNTEAPAFVSSRQLVKSDDVWYTVTLTNYYAQKRTIVYLNSAKVGETTESVAPKYFLVGDDSQALHRSFSELTFWRAAMNALEVSAHINGKMLKSSLEIYSPLSDAIKTDGIDNLATSLNVAEYVQGEVVDAIEEVKQDVDTEKVYYTIDGIRHNSMQHGINIVNGKKIIR